MSNKRRENFDELPPGIHKRTILPDAAFGRLWQSIVLSNGLKDSLLAQAVSAFQMRDRVDRTVLPFHGIILLVGPPGTGKTSLARGLAHRVADAFSGRRFQLLEVDPHALTSSSMGRTQRSVTELFSQSISEAAIDTPTIVLLDEVETLAADRSKLSLDANPIDVHRATDAVLVQVDALAEQHKQLLFVATSNFPQAVDSAFTSRCDFVLHLPLPDEAARHAILDDCARGLAKAFPNLADAFGPTALDRCAEASEGLDGRALRKAVANAFGIDLEVAQNPETVTPDHVHAAIRAAVHGRTGGGA